MLRRIGRGIPASAPLAKAAVEWAQPHAGWLFDMGPQDLAELAWDQLLTGVEQTPASDESRPPCCSPRNLLRFWRSMHSMPRC
ncbi:hypothetical protein FHR23_003075 [Stakelama sediminis]|uniref:Uncharacterized protein n=1 Tax=Stakelama sediminis TaxID=463200 RepID=A0A840Z2H4_9SPHN|nr:hypothetical protein [Stakelama sediminis]MBB5720115.1 hypothetical protein [Stakelama sediminis]